ncbi:MAG: ABC transporter ATP-binding protein [Nitratireductor sp.]|nr:ABC transporter ATP-binding protein [Nitratireductor sp.]
MSNVETSSAPGSVPKLAVKSLSHCYGRGESAVWALRDINVEVADGEFVVLLGQSGCGKSTLLNILGGLLHPTQGSVEVSGVPLFAAGKDNAPKLSYVFQEANLLPWRRVLENVTLPLELRGVPKAEREAEARELLEIVGLSDFALKMPYELSGGMRQRVSIARALVGQPDIVLMDEPFGALDAMTREHMNDFLQELWTKHRFSVVFVTHSIAEAVFLADRVVVLSSRPGAVRSINEVDIPRPRRSELMASEEYSNMSDIFRQELK